MKNTCFSAVLLNMLNHVELTPGKNVFCCRVEYVENDG